MASTRKDTPTRRRSPVAHDDGMLPQCDVIFDHMDDRLDDIHQTLKELQPMMLRLPADLALAVRQHAQECPAYQRAMRRAGGSVDSVPPVDDILKIAPRIPRWLIYLLGGGAGFGAIVTSILRYLEIF